MDNWNFLKYNQDLETTLSNFKKAALIHKNVRKDFKKLLDSKEIVGMKYFDISNHNHS